MKCFVVAPIAKVKKVQNLGLKLLHSSEHLKKARFTQAYYSPWNWLARCITKISKTKLSIMKNILTVFILLVSLSGFSQSDKSKVLDQRARNFHKAITTNDKAEWKKYMLENFTQALIERPMRAKVVTSEADNASATSSTTSETQTEEKLTMFARLHEDFGKGKINGVTTEDNSVRMTITTDGGMTGVFRFDAEPKSPWLIDKLSIQVEAGN
jgi:hypothetical protein